jgi:hypothetical protein
MYPAKIHALARGRAAYRAQCDRANLRRQRRASFVGAAGPAAGRTVAERAMDKAIVRLGRAFAAGARNAGAHLTETA